MYVSKPLFVDRRYLQVMWWTLHQRKEETFALNDYSNNYISIHMEVGLCSCIWGGEAGGGGALT